MQEYELHHYPSRDLRAASQKGKSSIPAGDPRSAVPSPGRNNVPDIVAVEAVDEDVPAEIEEVDGRRRHRHRRPPDRPLAARASGVAFSSPIVPQRSSG